MTDKHLDKMDFSVAMSIYRNDRAEEFKAAVESIYKFQSFKPNEIIIVIDGPVPLILEQTVEDLKNEIPIIKDIRFPENKGHAAARQTGLKAAKNEWIAVMDADDVAVPNRFELQIKAISENPGVSVIGGQIKEFVGSEDNIVGERIVPLEDKDIKKYLKSRCPMNMMTVMYKKSDMQAVGGFMDWYCEEDYYLWIRLAKKGYKFANVPDNLVNVRVGKEMYQRRGGWRYFKSEAKLQKYMLNQKIISIPRFLYNVTGRFAVQILMPNKIRGFLFQKLFRK